MNLSVKSDSEKNIYSLIRWNFELKLKEGWNSVILQWWISICAKQKAYVNFLAIQQCAWWEEIRNKVKKVHWNKYKGMPLQYKASLDLCSFSPVRIS